MFETLLTMEYMLEKDTKTKTIAYMVCFYNNKIYRLEQLKKRYQDKNLIEEIKKDKYFKEWDNNFVEKSVQLYDLQVLLIKVPACLGEEYAR